MSNTDTSDLRGRLAERAPAAGTAVEKAGDRAPTVAEQVKRMIDTQSTAFRSVLPKAVDPDRFSRLVLTAVKASPDLMQCFGTTQGQTTVLLAAMQAAALGLEPNTPVQDCWLLPRRNGNVMEAELSIGYRGLLKLARRSGTIKSLFAEVVHERDVFSWSRGLEEDHLEHIPYDGPDETAGALTHVYAIARFKDGGYQFIVLNRRQVEARRAMSKSWSNERARPYSPWTKWTESMWLKTGLRALCSYLELSAETADALMKDESPLRFNDDEGVIEVDAEKEPVPALPAPPPDDEEPLAPAAQDLHADPADDPAQVIKVRKALMAQASKAWPLDDLAPKDRAPRRDLLRHAVSFCELGEHISAADQSIAQMRRVETRLSEVESGAIGVVIDDEAKTVTVTAGERVIAVAFAQIGVE